MGTVLNSLHFKMINFLSRKQPNKSINPTAGYGLSRFRKPSVAAAGYLQLQGLPHFGKSPDGLFVHLLS